jgi:hypothetical protein
LLEAKDIVAESDPAGIVTEFVVIEKVVPSLLTIAE